MRGVAGLAAVACLLALGGVHAARAQNLPAPASVAKAQTYVSLEPVPRGSTFEIAAVVHVLPGFHMNSHKPSEDYLIPTLLTAKPHAGIKEIETIYPPGIDKKLSFSDKPLSVYTGTFTIRAKFSVAANAALGATSLPFTLQYQACNEDSCLPPVRIPVMAKIDVAPAGTKARQMSPQIFSSKPAGGTK
ncbi:MAG TPA: protein-disulfide reductase DsbD domain-containing protein [Candidatus Acidoferrales bacterium]|nr:protein-disulfide reductase DsbD domain-containing protein [Candidatus Acidoferrales bacterium]